MEDFDKCFEEHEQLMHYVCHKYENSASKLGLIYSDLYEECIYTFYKAWHKYDESRGVQFSAYLARAMSNGIRILMRRETSSTRVPHGIKDTEMYSREGNDDGVDIYSTLESNTDLEGSFEHSMLIEYICKNMKGHKKLKDLFILFQMGYTQVEIAKILGYNQSHVSRLRKELQKEVKRVMGEYYDE